MPQKPSDLQPQFEFLWGHDILRNMFGSQVNNSLLVKINNKISNKFVRTTKNELGLKGTYHYL